VVEDVEPVIVHVGELHTVERFPPDGVEDPRRLPHLRARACERVRVCCTGVTPLKVMLGVDGSVCADLR
jgi:hypothetical protein